MNWWKKAQSPDENMSPEAAYEYLTNLYARLYRHNKHTPDKYVQLQMFQIVQRLKKLKLQLSMTNRPSARVPAKIR